MKKPFKVPPLEPLTERDDNNFNRALNQPASPRTKHRLTKRPKESPAALQEYPQDRIGKVKGNA